MLEMTGAAIATLAFGELIKAGAGKRLQHSLIL